MNVKISFHNMPHSTALENHTKAKLEKVKELFKHADRSLQISCELFMNAQTAHTEHHTVEFRFRAGTYNLTTHDTGTDMYKVVESTISKMTAVIKKEKSKNNDKKHKVQTEKTAFAR